ncbi:lytic transglycosylase domain-containing protein [Boseongicola sp. H5]|uniref:lytic transglycosylase domain-containing protein n=1 Tax=Boseongicola sp. H5 TaxID=2763261 RepID=UPI001D0A993E|nr:lytic transglycosylase domain-containing protein [Boseongicola sp. H5]
MRACRDHSTAGRLRPARRLGLLLLTGLLTASGLPTTAVAQDAPITHEITDPYAVHIAEASQRFRIPAHWIRAVMQVESAGRVRAVSSAGAMGLMQIMPDTWADLRIRHRLGRDPFDPRDNILGGTAYLREMFDRFGSPGFLAAYNAGPDRYRQHLETGRPLPRETRAYVATLTAMLGFEAPDGKSIVAARPSDWREAPLFVDGSDRSSSADRLQNERGAAARPWAHSSHDDAALNEPSNELFVVRSDEGGSR